MGNTDNKGPSKPPGLTAERMLGFVVPFLIFLVAIVIALDWDYKGIVLWVFAVSLLMIGIFIFTAGGNHMPPQRVTWMFRFAYAYTLMALIGSTVPFMRADWTPLGEVGDREHPDLAQVRVLRACACPAHADGTDDVPRVVQCDDKGSAPWVLNVGGTVYPAGPCLDRAAGAANAISGAGADPGGSMRKAGDDTERDGPAEDATQEAAPGVSGVPSSRPATGAQVRGGLVVPFYVIVLAVVGGAVSMTRRVPEYQKRVCRWYEECTQAAMVAPARVTTVRRRRRTPPVNNPGRTLRRVARVADVRRFLSNDIPSCLSFPPSPALRHPFHRSYMVCCRALKTNDNPVQSGMSFSGNRLRSR